MSNKVDILILSGPSTGDVFHFNLEDNGEIVIGRALESNLVLQEPTVSRRHSKIFAKSGIFFISDQGSAMGTVHMGFKLQAGDENGRQIVDGDEFKIGEQIFRFNVEKEKTQKKNKSQESTTSKKSSSSLLEIIKKQKYLVLVALLAVLVFLLLAPEEHQEFQAKDAEVMLVPHLAVVGYWPSSNPKEQNLTRKEKIQFEIPSTDILLEYSYISQGEVNVSLEGFEFAKLPESGTYSHRAAIIRGVGSINSRKLIFGNVQSDKNWAVKEVRVTPLTLNVENKDLFLSQINEAISLVEGIDKSPEGLFLLLRSLQLLDVILMKELKLDAQDVKIKISSQELIDFSNLSALRQRLEVIKNERLGENGTNLAKEHQNEVTNIVSQIDAELWRRLNSRINQAKLAAKINNSVEANDLLLSAQGMFLNELDYRWTIANRLLNDNSIVPKKVRDNPNKYRKTKF